MRVSTSQMFARGLAAMQSQQAGLSRTQQQVASGQRILQPADDPTGAKRVIDLERGIALSKQYEDNGNLARSRLEREESALVGVRDVLDKVRELALQGNNATISAPDRAAIARELQVQLEQLVAVANTQDGNGEYLFSGFATRTQPFSLAPAGGASYAGDQGSRRVQIGPNRDIAVGDPGNAIFQNIRTGNGTFVTGYDAANTGSGVIDPGSVVDLGAWDGGTYSVRVAADSGASGTLAFADSGTPDTLGYSLAIDGTTVYSVTSAGAPVTTLTDLASQINDDEPSTGVRAIVDGGALYLMRTSPSAAPIVVTESLSGASDGEADGMTTYFGQSLNGASTPSNSLSFSSPARWFAYDSAATQVASGDYLSGAAITFRGIKTDVRGSPDLGDSFSVAPSTDQDMFTTVQSLISALTVTPISPGDGTRRQNDVNRALVDIDRALERVSESRAAVGARLGAIDQEASAGQDYQLILNELLSTTRDLDMAEAITRLTSQSTALQAAQQSFVRIQGLSLFDLIR